MRTHEIARILSSLAAALRQGPNVPLDKLREPQRGRGSARTSDLPAALSTLVALSKFNKSQWQAVIKEYRLPISVPPVSSTRDIVWKILRHLEQDVAARRRVRMAAERTRSDISPELMNALDSLLK